MFGLENYISNNSLRSPSSEKEITLKLRNKTYLNRISLIILH